jgi:hypothetical protein
MRKRYDLSSIRNLLVKGYTFEQLISLCYDTDVLLPFYRQLTKYQSQRIRVIDALLKYAEQKILPETLLVSLKKYDPVSYEQYQPYNIDSPSNVKLPKFGDNIMDPITTAILLSLDADIDSGNKQVGENAVTNAYIALKSVLRNKYGDESKIMKAVADLEDEPEFEPYKTGLQQRVKAEKADQDSTILEAAQTLLDVLNSQSRGQQSIQNVQHVYGNYNAVAGSGGQATVNVNQPNKEKE